MPYKDPEDHRTWAREYGRRPEVKAAAKAWKAANREKLKQYQDTHYITHKAERNVESVERAKTPHGKALARWGKLRHHGWSQERYLTVLELQGNSCSICKLPFDKSPHADHAHTDPPIPRGLLCSNCNTGLGLFKDKPELLEDAAQYLRNFQYM